ncbi:hypothetical protein ACVIHF_006715 [Bradyrhizobium sp. USDA 4506]
MQRPHLVERLDAVDEALGIVKPVDADRERLAIEAAPQPRHVGMRHRLGRLLRELAGIDADRKHRGAGAAERRIDHAVAHLEVEIVLHIAQEVLAVLIGLEADQVIGQHRLDQLAMIGHARDHRARRPWRVQEEADRLRDAEIAQLGAECEEMIILDPEHGIRLAEAQQRARHERVHFAIARVVLARRTNQIGARMHRGPQRRIGKAFVIAAIVRGRQIEHRQRARPERFDLCERFLQVPVADASAGTNPYCPCLFHHRQQCRSQPPRHGFIGFSARDAVRYDDEVHQVPSCWSTRVLTTIHQDGS